VTERDGIPLRYLAEINPPTPEIGLLAPDDAVTFLPLEAVQPDGGLDVSRRRSIREGVNSYNIIREGDIILPRVTPSFEHNRVVVARGLLNGLAMASTEVHVVRPFSPGLADFLHYRLRAADVQAQGRADMIGVAGLKRVPERTLGNVRVSAEARSRAGEIVSLLGRRIDDMSGLRDRLVALEALATAARKALIEEAIAGCSGAAVPIWSVVDEQRPVMYGIVLPGPHVPDGVPVIKGGDIERGHPDPSAMSRVAPEVDERHARSRVRAGDVLVTIRGSYGAVAVATPQLAGANITQDTARIAPGPRVLPAWLAFALRAPSVQAQLEARATGASVKGVNIRDLRRVRIPVPPVAEQEEAVRRLDLRLGRLADLLADARRLRALLDDYRDSLITEQFITVSRGVEDGRQPARRGRAQGQLVA
jgi:type I restriction enzyme S subunit